MPKAKLKSVADKQAQAKRFKTAAAMIPAFEGQKRFERAMKKIAKPKQRIEKT